MWPLSWKLNFPQSPCGKLIRKNGANSQSFDDPYPLQLLPWKGGIFFPPPLESGLTLWLALASSLSWNWRTSFKPGPPEASCTYRDSPGTLPCLRLTPGWPARRWETMWRRAETIPTILDKPISQCPRDRPAKISRDTYPLHSWWQMHTSTPQRPDKLSTWSLYLWTTINGIESSH